MKNYKIIAIILLIAFAKVGSAQNKHFPTQGTIEFEKRINMYALLKEMSKKMPENTYFPAMIEEYQKRSPQFKSLKSTLSFNGAQTLFTPIEAPIVQNDMFADYPVILQNNTIATNTATQTSVVQKRVFEELYLVKDSTRKINWKITNEIRNIAGYDCRRANALVMDSIYVVAFYCDQIPVSGGPETFTGLPGMILGVALPYEHVTWFATKISEVAVAEEKLKAPVKGKAVNNKALFDILSSAMKQHGSNGKEMLKALML
ncbi:MAG: GLPGLI family protein [Chitinophagaceae bacterium]|nr:MAG: GLPGLI family protein [Chitinophagaceae bacterium]